MFVVSAFAVAAGALALLSVCLDVQAADFWSRVLTSPVVMTGEALVDAQASSAASVVASRRLPHQPEGGAWLGRTVPIVIPAVMGSSSIVTLAHRGFDQG